MTTKIARMTPESLSLGALRSTRVAMRLPVRLEMKEEKGTFQTLAGWTLVLSKYAARIECRRPLDVNQEVMVTLLPAEERNGMGKVVWCDSHPNNNGNFEFSVELGDAEGLWGVRFPSR